ncbi:hypothetical protein AW878_18980 [Bordetella pseudohinzii]|nr:hypothetical protein BBN53_09830 [Bordetella pseudohinzii]KXA75993.1 hypothetical protein AW878_18980 [Bordetella pseudohinzii]KXA81234.1 hypothetical protein AW877_04705 [Bordetella pseudohinzii]
MDYSNSATTIIRAASGGSYTGTNITGSTTANGAYGAYAQNGGQITLNGGTFLLNATATNAHGLFASGAGSQINANGVTITTTAGNSSAAISNAAGGGIALGTGSILSSDAGTTLQVSAGAVSGNNLSLTSNRLGAALTPQLIALPSYPGGLAGTDPIDSDHSGDDAALAPYLIASPAHAVSMGGGTLNLTGLTTVNAGGMGMQVTGGVVQLENLNLTAGPGGADNTWMHGVSVTNASYTQNGNLTAVVDSVAGNGIYARTNGIVALGGAGKTVSVTLSNVRNNSINQVNEASALRADLGTLTATGTVQLLASQGRGYGLWTGASGGTITINGNTAIETRGREGLGIRQDNGAITLNGDLSIITGKNPVADALDGAGSAGMRLLKGTIRVTGSTTVETHGGVVAVGTASTRESAYGIWATSASRIAGLDVQGDFMGPVNVTTTGAAAHGIYNDMTSGTLVFHDTVTVGTSGGTGSVTWARASLSAFGTNETVGAWGVNNMLNSVTTFQGALTVNNTGDQGGGVRAMGGTVNLASANITTSGAGAHGVMVGSNTASGTTYRGTIIASGPVNASTSGAAAHAVYGSGAGTTLNLNGGGRLRATGAASFGILAANSATVNGTGVFDIEGALQSQDTATAALDMKAGSLFTGTTARLNTSTFNMTQGGTWNMTGNSTLSDLNVAGGQVLYSAPAGGVYKTLTATNVTGGNGGIIGLNTYLGADGSPSDLLIVDGGAATGSTGLRITNNGGPGVLTTANGIQVVQATNGATTAASAFSLSGRAVAGPYEYRLYRGSSDPADESWYLRSEKTPVPPTPPDPPTPPNPPEPLYRPEVAAYLANQRLASEMFVHSLHDRLGEPQYIEGQQFDNEDDKRRALWLRMTGRWQKSRSGNGEYRVDSDTVLLQGGGDIAQWQLASETDRLHLGAMAGYGDARSSARADGNPYKAHGRVEGYTVGLYGTWYQNDAERLGAYVDTWFQYGWFRNRVEGDALDTVKYDAQGWAISGEAGYALRVKGDWILEPQAQLIYTEYDPDSVTEANGTKVGGGRSDGTIWRLGLRGHRTFDMENGRKIQPFLTLNWWHNDTDGQYRFNQVTQGGLYPRDTYEVKLGLHADFTKGWTGWTNVSGSWGAHHYQQYAARIGMKYTW